MDRDSGFEKLNMPNELPPHIQSLATLTVIAVQEGGEVKFANEEGYNMMVSTTIQSLFQDDGSDEKDIAGTLCAVAKEAIDLYMKGVIKMRPDGTIMFNVEGN